MFFQHFAGGGPEKDKKEKKGRRESKEEYTSVGPSQSQNTITSSVCWIADTQEKQRMSNTSVVAQRPWHQTSPHFSWSRCNVDQFNIDSTQNVAYINFIACTKIKIKTTIPIFIITNFLVLMLKYNYKCKWQHCQLRSPCFCLLHLVLLAHLKTETYKFLHLEGFEKKCTYVWQKLKIYLMLLKLTSRIEGEIAGCTVELTYKVRDTHEIGVFIKIKLFENRFKIK